MVEHGEDDQVDQVHVAGAVGARYMLRPGSCEL